MLRGWVAYRSELSVICHVCDSLPKSVRRRECDVTLSGLSAEGGGAGDDQCFLHFPNVPLTKDALKSCGGREGVLHLASDP